MKAFIDWYSYLSPTDIVTFWIFTIAEIFCLVLCIYHVIQTVRCHRMLKKGNNRLSEMIILGRDESGNYTGGKTELMTDFALECLKVLRHRQAQTPSVKGPLEWLKHYKDKYSSIKLENCPLCNGEAKLQINLAEYGHDYAGAYDVKSYIRCEKCGCRTDDIILHINIYSIEENIDERFEALVNLWNKRGIEKCDSRERKNNIEDKL